MNYAADVTQGFEREQRAQALMALAVSRDSHWSADPLESFCHRGFARYASYAKAAIDAVTAEDAAAGLAPLNAAFIESVNRTSILGQLGALEIPLDQTGRIDTSTMTAQIVDETTMKPVTGATVTVSGPPVKAIAQLVVTAELLRSTSPQMQAGLTRALVSDVAAAVDTKVITVLTSGPPAAAADVAILLASVSGGAPARPVLIGSYADLVPLAPTLADLQGLGVIVLPCAAAAGLLLVVDASGLLVSDGGAEIVSARHANIQLDDGSGGTPGPTRSLFQANLACLRAERWFSIAMRSDAVAWAAMGTP
jgi:hypothetical protein